MKITLFISIIIITLISCRSYREKTRLENSRSMISEGGRSIRYGFQFTEKDSQNRTWYFSTDSILSFHPDYGLLSAGGNLSVSERRVGLHHMQVDIDSLEEQRNAETTYAREDHSQTRYRNPWWVWGLAALVALVSYLASRLLRRKRDK